MLCLVRRQAVLQELNIARPSCGRHRTFFSALGLSASSAPDPKQRFHQRKILPYRQYQLYDIVADVDSYHHFIPYCIASRVLQKTGAIEDSGEISRLQAELKIGFMGFEEKYISNVECRPYKSVQAVASGEIPLFKSLVTTWRFQPASSTSPHPTADLASTLKQPATSENAPTLVTFDLEYEFAHQLHAHVSAAFFGQVSKMMIRAFEERCLIVYGPGTR